MPFCPTCLDEFRDGFTRCKDCDIALVDELPFKPKMAIETDDNDGHTVAEYCDMIYLCSLSESYKAELVLGALRENGIAAMKKMREAGAYIQIVWGFSVFGADIWVDSKKLAEACDIVRGILGDEVPE